MRSVRIAFVLFSALIVFFFLNSTSGKLFPATKLPTEDSSPYTSAFSECNNLSSGESGSYDNTAYNKCINDAQTAENQKMKARYDTAGRDQIRNIYVVLGNMFAVLIIVVLVHRRLPLLSAALLLGGLVFTLYFPTSNVVSGWYSSAYRMSDAVKDQLHNTMILASVLGFIGVVLTSMLGLERRRPNNNAVTPASVDPIPPVA